MSQFLKRIQKLAAAGELRVSKHGYQELEKDGIALEAILESIATAEAIEEYPNYYKGHCVLVLQMDENGLPLHVLWGAGPQLTQPAVLITAYRPDPSRWSHDFRKRV